VEPHSEEAGHQQQEEGHHARVGGDVRVVGEVDAEQESDVGEDKKTVADEPETEAAGLVLQEARESDDVDEQEDAGEATCDLIQRERDVLE